MQVEKSSRINTSQAPRSCNSELIESENELGHICLQEAEKTTQLPISIVSLNILDIAPCNTFQSAFLTFWRDPLGLLIENAYLLSARGCCSKIEKQREGIKNGVKRMVIFFFFISVVLVGSASFSGIDIVFISFQIDMLESLFFCSLF